jgi:hypothetical protein
MAEKTMQEIRDRQEKERNDFQDKCPHKKLSDWTEYHWAIGHYSGTDVKYCLRCEKTIEKRNNFPDPPTEAITPR